MIHKLLKALLILLFVASLGSNAYAAKGKYLLILQAGKESHEGMARALHALLYSHELREHGHEVALLFDGAGTQWAEEWSKPDSTDKLAVMYKELRDAGVTSVICDFCAMAFHVKQSLTENKVPLTTEYKGHPSIAKWVDKGYQIIVL